MALTAEQKAALAADVALDPAFASLPHNSDGAFAIAEAYNLIVSPAFIVWKTDVATKQIMENGFVWTAVDALTAGKARIWDWMSRVGSINPAKVNVRQGLVDCFGASSAMATAIQPHLKRSATRVEKLFASGTGSDASPATMAFEGNLSYAEVRSAMGW